MLIIALNYYEHMPRKKCIRWLEDSPQVTLYKPAGIPACRLEKVVLSLDEFEAIRLADFERLYQEEAALKMGISRATFGRIVDEARYKIADALTGGKALVIDGGNIRYASCGHEEDKKNEGNNINQ